MDKTAIKNFAIWARNALIRNTKDKCGLVGIREEGIQNPLPQSTAEIQFFDAGTGTPSSITGKQITQRDALVQKIREKERDSDYLTAYNYVVEQVAYTWFNRLIAIRFMEVNDYLPSRIRVLSSEQAGKLEPDIVTTPFDADFEFRPEEEEQIHTLKDRGQKEDMDALFRMLFIKQCSTLHEILPNLFQKVDGHDYTELLLNISFTDRDGVVYHLVNDIPESNFDISQEGQVEIIGWLYQYYNAELKDDTFALLKKNVKITKERIPAATQLFTPDWIVKYMVENSLGRLWVEGHPNDGLKENWRYYLDEAEQEPGVQAQLAEIRKEYAVLNPEDIKVIDPCMGSGHILAYAFDVLMQIYESQGYTQRDAAQSILANNLFGLDIDERAAQLAYFAVMMKARQYDRRILTRGIRPHVLAIQESNGIHRAHLDYFGAGMSELEKSTARMQLKNLLETLRDAKEYGSILQAENCEWDLLRRFVAGMDVVSQITLDSIGVDDTAEKLTRLIDVGQTLAQKYDVVVTNPPYMAVSNGDNALNKFIKDNYPDSKGDLFAVFIERCGQMAKRNGYQAMITQHSWMFLSGFEKLRIKLLATTNIVSMAHLGPRAFEEISGEVVQTTAFVFRRATQEMHRGVYERLVSGTTQTEKETLFLKHTYQYQIAGTAFEAIPGNVFAYWVSNSTVELFQRAKRISDFGDARQGMATGNNEYFVRYWYEVKYADLALNAISHEDFKNKNAKYIPYTKSSGICRWYGNYYTILRFDVECYEKLLQSGNHLPSRQYYFRENVNWSLISTDRFGARFAPKGAAFDVGAHAFFASDPKPMLAYLNSTVFHYLVNFLSPTMNYNSGIVAQVPCKGYDSATTALSEENISISKRDWDSYETSWDFKRNPLV